MTSCLSELKFTPSFCFPFKIPDDPTATNTYVIPDVSGTNAPQPKNGGIDIQNVYAQMAPIILKELL